MAYRLSLTELGGEVALDRNFKPDPLIDPDETIEDADYRRANAAFGYQRGHLAPLASFKGTPYASEVNLLSNITPQKVGLNNRVTASSTFSTRFLNLQYAQPKDPPAARNG